jgi:hypothetical protein
MGMGMSDSDKQVEEQQEFIAWLKENGLYHWTIPAAAMQFGHKIWKLAKESDA